MSCPVFQHSEVGLLARAKNVPKKVQETLDRLSSEYQAYLDGSKMMPAEIATSIAGTKLAFNYRTEVQQLVRYYRTGRI
jgi:uncharacterized Zn finger protein (UPF0148 family)